MVAMATYASHRLIMGIRAVAGQLAQLFLTFVKPEIKIQRSETAIEY